MGVPSSSIIFTAPGIVWSVGEIQCDFIQRKIGVLDLLGEHDVAVAIVARQRSGPVGTYGEQNPAV